MLFFGVFLRESARTAAKSRTNLSTHSGKAIKGLGRLAPNLAHMCRFILEWIYAKQIAPRDTRGHMGGFRGSKNQNLGKLSNGWTDWQKSGEAVKRLDRLAPNLAHMCRFIREWIYAKQIALRDTRGHLEVLRGQTFKSLGKLSNGWTDFTNFGSRLRIRLGMDIG